MEAKQIEKQETIQPTFVNKPRRKTFDMANSDKPILFTKPDCGKCDKLKDRLTNKGQHSMPLSTVNADSVEGMALASYFEVVKENMPCLVHNGEKVIAGNTIGIYRYLRNCGIIAD